MKSVLLRAIIVAAVLAAPALPAQGASIIDEWASVKAPAARRRSSQL